MTSLARGEVPGSPPSIRTLEAAAEQLLNDVCAADAGQRRLRIPLKVAGDSRLTLASVATLVRFAHTQTELELDCKEEPAQLLGHCIEQVAPAVQQPLQKQAVARRARSHHILLAGARGRPDCV